MSKSLKKGRIIGNRFQIENHIMDGGFGTTYSALDLQHPFAPDCIIKQIQNSSFGSETEKRIEREAQALYILGRHPQIPEYRGTIKENNEMYIAMELIKGKNLEQYIEINDIYDQKSVVKLLIELLELLDFVHSHKMIHRDINPKNIMIHEKDNKPFLIDFGIIKDISNMGKSKLNAYTEGYAPKEQKIGEAVTSSDLYSLGKTAIFCLTGFHPTTIAQENKEKELSENYWQRFVSHLKPEVEQFINKTVEENPLDRYQSAREMLDTLTFLLSNINFEDIRTIKTSELEITSPNLEEVNNSKKQFAFPTSKLRFKYAVFNKKEVLEIDGKVTQTIVKINEEVDLEMVWIHAGNFLDFSITDFFLGKYPVTQRQWKAVASLPQITRKLNPVPSFFKGDDLPVERISWKDAIEFCARLSHHTGKSFRLPTEIEWEYACRAKSKTPYFCGDRIDKRWATFFEVNQNKGTRGVTETIYPNKFGLFDMLGNVWEWCNDEWSNNYINSVKDSFSTRYRVRKGGSWQNSVKDCRCSRRSRATNDLRNYITGFRLAADNR